MTIWLSTLIGQNFPPDSRHHGSVVRVMDKPVLLVKAVQYLLKFKT